MQFADPSQKGYLLLKCLIFNNGELSLVSSELKKKTNKKNSQLVSKLNVPHPVPIISAPVVLSLSQQRKKKYLSNIEMDNIEMAPKPKKTWGRAGGKGGKT